MNAYRRKTVHLPGPCPDRELYGPLFLFLDLVELQNWREPEIAPVRMAAETPIEDLRELRVVVNVPWVVS
jgi:hypothetical protein